MVFLQNLIHIFKRRKDKNLKDVCENKSRNITITYLLRNMILKLNKD